MSSLHRSSPKYLSSPLVFYSIFPSRHLSRDILPCLLNCLPCCDVLILPLSLLLFPLRGVTYYLHLYSVMLLLNAFYFPPFCLHPRFHPIIYSPRQPKRWLCVGKFVLSRITPSCPRLCEWTKSMCGLAAWRHFQSLTNDKDNQLDQNEGTWIQGEVCL